MKSFIIKYRHAAMLLYAFLYIPWFAYLETSVGHNPTYIIHMKIDDWIPFNEYFIIPYMLWFGFVAIALLYFFFRNTTDFYRLTSYLFIGMTVFLIVSTLFPNGQQLRPTEFVRDNIFVDLVRNLYKIDTPTNIFPSIHAYNSICVLVAVLRSEDLKNRTWIKAITILLSISIVLSTVFLKQHSMLDVIGAIILSIAIYPLIYKIDYKTMYEKLVKKKAKQLDMAD